MIFADFSMGATKKEERGGLFTRHDYWIRRCHLGCLDVRRSVSQFFFMRSVPKKFLLDNTASVSDSVVVKGFTSYKKTKYFY